MKQYHIRYLLAFALVVLLACTAMTQSSYHITTGQGLTTHQLTVLIKDRQNNMWFGSYNGLHKHEGTSIKVYGKSGKDSSSLSSKEIHPVFEDRLGFIWAGTTGGLDRLDPYKGSIKHYKVKSVHRNDDNIGYIYSIFQDNEDNIWFTTDAGMFVVDYNTGNYRQVLDGVETGDGLPEFGIGYKSTFATKDGIWMITGERPVFYNYKSRQFFHRYHNPLQKPIFQVGGDNGTAANTDMCVDKAGNLFFIAHNSFLVKYNIHTEKIDSFRFEFPKNAWQCCFSLAADFKGNIWIGFRYGGILLFNQSSLQFTPIRYEDANSLIASDYVYSLCEDYLQRMWVTTSNGIFVINYYDSAVQQKYLSSKKEFTNINYEACIISQDDKGNIYAPYNVGGLFQYNVFSTHIRHFPVIDTATREYSYVFTGQKNKLLVGSRRTLKEADTSLHKLVLKPPQSPLYKKLASLFYRVTWVYQKDSNAIYFKKANGLLYYYNGTPDLEEIQSQGFMNLANASKDKKYLYFIGLNGNLIKRNLSSLVMDTIRIVDKMKVQGFSYSNARDVADDGNGNIWVTSQNGLLKYNIQKDSLSIYTTANGLLHDFAFSLCADSKNRLWVGSMGGVNLYDPQKDAFINVFPESPDKLSDYFGSSLEAKDGHIYFLFGGKLININPDKLLQRQTLDRTLRLNEIQINGIPTDTISKTLSSLAYTQNRIYFRFGLQEFTEPEKVKYAYQLQGLDSTWIEMGNHSEITFNSLDPNTYILHVKATDLYGNEVRRQLLIPFTINPPFWQTWWFKLLYIFLTGLIIYWFIRQKQIKINEQKEELEIEQSINYFSTAMHGQKNIDEMLWSVTKNCISKLGFMDCVIYLMDEERNMLVQKAAHGPKNPVAFEIYNRVEIALGSGIVGSVAASGQGELIKDTSKDSRYIVDDEVRIAEIAVPILYEGKVLGVIDSEDPRKNYFKDKHFSILTNIASICAIKIVAIQAEENRQHALLQMAEQKRLLAGLEIKALRAQMNPHFIFNAMNSIQHFSLQNDFDNANKYLSTFSKLLRMALQQSEQSRFSLANEIEMLEPYLVIESLRLGADFSYRFNVEEDLETEAVLIPSMIIQPFVENALKHGLSSKKGNRLLTISFEMMDDHHLRCAVQDNGIGRKKAMEIGHSHQELTPHKSLGMKLVKERLELLEDGANKMAGIRIEDLYDENGTSAGTLVEVILPVE